MELNSSIIRKSQRWRAKLERLRLTMIGDGGCTDTDLTEIGGYLLQQMGFAH